MNITNIKRGRTWLIKSEIAINMARIHNVLILHMTGLEIIFNYNCTGVRK